MQLSILASTLFDTDYEGFIVEEANELFSHVESSYEAVVYLYICCKVGFNSAFSVHGPAGT